MPPLHTQEERALLNLISAPSQYKTCEASSATATETAASTFQAYSNLPQAQDISN